MKPKMAASSFLPSVKADCLLLRSITALGLTATESRRQVPPCHGGRGKGRIQKHSTP